jgi:ribonuclease HI
MRLADSNTVRLIWVPGHHDILGNEIADELAREGSTTDLVENEPALPLTQSFLKSIIRNEAHQKHIQYWKNLPK